MTGISLTQDEARDRAALIEVASYDIDLTLSTERSFGSRTTIRFEAREPGGSTFVELADAERLTATLNGEVLPDSTIADGRIRLDGLAADNELVVDAVLPSVNHGDGMHRYVDPADGETYLSAFLGSDVAHRVFACFDQPDLKASIRLRVTAPEHWTVLANGLPESRDGEVRTYAATPPIPTYLFVVCAGPWHSVTWTHAGLPFGWHARRSMADALERDAEELRRITTACFDHYATVFDEPYPFDSYDQVMAPGLNWGALETPGCVTFRDEFLTAGPPTEGERASRAMVIAHEMAHMWFGDLVSLRWWEDIWLNESFADYMGYQVAGAAAGFADSWTAFTVEREHLGYAADVRRSTHPVAPPPGSLHDADAGFEATDMITYAKGNAVLRQLVTWVGEETFLRGVNRYLTAHAFGNADLSDFLQALDAESDRDVHGWARSWLQESGFDTLVVRRDDQVPVLSRDGSRPHRFTVTAHAMEGDRLLERGRRMVDLGADDVRFDDWAGLAVLPNADDKTFAAVRTDADSWVVLAAGIESLTAPQRAVVWATALDLVGEARLPAADLLEMVRAHLPAERLPAIWEAVVGRVRRTVLPRLLRPDQLSGARAVLAEVGAETQDPALLTAGARLAGACSVDVDTLEGWLREGRTTRGVEVDRTLRWDVLTRLAELDAVDATRLEAEAAADPSSAAETGVARASAALPHDAAKARAWARFSDDDVSSRVFTAIGSGLWVPEQAPLLTGYVARYLAEAPHWAAHRGQGFSREIGRLFPSYAVTESTRDLLRKALAGDLPTVLARAWNDRLDDLERDLLGRRPVL